MTYETNRETNRYPTPNDPYENPYRVTTGRDEARTRNPVGSALLFGALLLAAIGAFIYYSSGYQPTVATNEMRPPITQPKEQVRPAPAETTGAGNSTMEPGERPATSQQ